MYFIRTVRSLDSLFAVVVATGAGAVVVAAAVIPFVAAYAAYIVHDTFF